MDRVYYGAETKKALTNFGTGNLPPELIAAYTEVKKACIMAIQEHEKRFASDVYPSLLRSMDEILEGKHNGHFPLHLQQGGAGTSINMNMNEVIASLAMEYASKESGKPIDLDPIEDINRYQSTNDTFPTAVTIVVYRKLSELEQKVVRLQECLIKKEKEYESLLVTGRTEMQSALPITLGQVFASWAGSIERDRWRLNKLKERVRSVALGGTAIGTCFFAPQKFVFLAEKHLRQITGLPLSRSQNLTDEIANQDKLSELAGGLKLCAENIGKICGDLMLYTSSFIGEIRHPVLQKGSTIMAAKTNPVILEFAKGLSIDVQLECQKISVYSMNGSLQLNAYLPFILDSLLRAFDGIFRAIDALMDRFFSGMEIDAARMESNLIASNVLLNSLVPLIGYHHVEAIYRALSLLEKKPATMDEWKEVIIKSSGIERSRLNEYLNPIRLTTSCKE